MRRFNTAGPCRSEYDYLIPPERRMPEAAILVDHQAYFALHAPRQTGKTTTMHALALRLTEAGRYAALHFTCETARIFPEDISAAERVIWSSSRTATSRPTAASTCLACSATSPTSGARTAISSPAACLTPRSPRSSC
jgi:hypothetical protein